MEQDRWDKVRAPGAEWDPAALDWDAAGVPDKEWDMAPAAVWVAADTEGGINFVPQACRVGRAAVWTT